MEILALIFILGACIVAAAILYERDDEDPVKIAEDNFRCALRLSGLNDVQAAFVMTIYSALSHTLTDPTCDVSRLTFDASRFTSHASRSPKDHPHE